MSTAIIYEGKFYDEHYPRATTLTYVMGNHHGGTAHHRIFQYIYIGEKWYDASLITPYSIHVGYYNYFSYIHISPIPN